MAYIVMSVLVGGGISLMISINGELSSRAGQVISLVIIYTVGLVISSLLVPLSRRTKRKERNKPPFLYFISGSLGLVIVSLNNATFSTGGVVLVLSGMLAGQSIVAFLFDLRKRERGNAGTLWKDSIALMLIAAGVVAVGIAYKIPLTGILLSWVPGILLMVQILMNASLASYYGDMKTVQIVYVTGLAVIVPVAFISGVLPGSLVQALPEIPAHILLGGGLLGVIGMAGQNILVRRMSALLLVLGNYAGEFFMGIIIDLSLGKAVSYTHAAGLLLVVSGLLVKNLPPFRSRRKRENLYTTSISS